MLNLVNLNADIPAVIIAKQSPHAGFNRAARIEPVAEEGQIFASDAFAALAAITKTSNFLCDYAGTRKLPKGAGMISTFLVRPAR